MSRFLFNLVILMVMFFTLTTMPVNKKILDFDFSFEKFTAWEKEKSGEETPVTPINTVADATLTMNTAYLFQSEELVLNVESQTDVGIAASEIRDKMTLSVFDKDRQIASLSGTDIPFMEDRLIDKTHVALILDVNALKLPAGQYRLEFVTTSTHVDPALTAALVTEMTSFEGKTYLVAKDIAVKGNTAIQIFYADESLTYLIPLAQESLNDKLLRKTANELASPPPAGMGLSPIAPAPRMPNIVYADGLASLYFKSADLGAYAAGNDITRLTLDAIRHSMFHVRYVKQLRFLVDGRTDGTFLNGVDLSMIFERDTVPNAWLGVRTSAGRLYLSPFSVYPTLKNPVEDIFALLRSGLAQDGTSEALIAPIPANVSFISSKQEGAQLTVDLSLEGDLYGGDPKWAAFMFDALTTSLTSIEGVDSVMYTLNGAPVSDLNGLPLATPQRAKAILNPIG